MKTAAHPLKWLLVTRRRAKVSWSETYTHTIFKRMSQIQYGFTDIALDLGIFIIQYQTLCPSLNPTSYLPKPCVQQILKNSTNVRPCLTDNLPAQYPDHKDQVRTKLGSGRLHPRSSSADGNISSDSHSGQYVSETVLDHFFVSLEQPLASLDEVNILLFAEIKLELFCKKLTSRSKDSKNPRLI